MSSPSSHHLDEDDEESQVLAQPFYPSPQPLLDLFLQPLSFPSSSSSSSSSPASPNPASDVSSNAASSVPHCMQGLEPPCCSARDSQGAVKRRSAIVLCEEEQRAMGRRFLSTGRYTAEERKQRINRYRAKRDHRNFNRTIKYACRKTLAESRPRIRGRFAKNDELAIAPQANADQVAGAASSLVHQDDQGQEDCLWVAVPSTAF